MVAYHEAVGNHPGERTGERAGERLGERAGERTVYPSLGLRELKKLRTRATIVDVASRLCARQGYENTTVEQIAAAAEVSPRTFSRYFPSKEAVIGALIEETSEHVSALSHQPTGITEHDALVRAHVEVFRAAERGEPGAMSFDRVRGFLQIVNSSPMLSLAAFTFRPDGGPTAPVIRSMAARMETSVHDPAVRILFDTWAVLMAVACGSPDTDVADPGRVSDRIESTYRVFVRLWQPWHPGVSPDQTSPDNSD
jgi:AcrR family transcriptional regulator